MPDDGYKMYMTGVKRLENDIQEVEEVCRNYKASLVENMNENLQRIMIAINMSYSHTQPSVMNNSPY